MIVFLNIVLKNVEYCTLERRKERMYCLPVAKLFVPKSKLLYLYMEL